MSWHAVKRSRKLPTTFRVSHSIYRAGGIVFKLGVRHDQRFLFLVQLRGRLDFDVYVVVSVAISVHFAEAFAVHADARVRLRSRRYVHGEVLVNAFHAPRAAEDGL